MGYIRNLIFRIKIIFSIKHVKELFAIYLMVKMLFDLCKCKKCYGGIQNLKLTLWNILPKDICGKIDEYNAICEKCKNISLNQTKFITKWTTHVYFRCESKIELQLKWFELQNGRPLSKCNPLSQVEALFSILDNVGKPFKYVLKSFAFAKGDFDELDIICTLHCKISYKRELRELYHNVKTQTYLYRRKPYPQNILMKMIFYEYILAMIGDDIHYFEIEDIKQYLVDIFD